jgi:hypothetical protein
MNKKLVLKEFHFGLFVGEGAKLILVDCCAQKSKESELNRTLFQSGSFIRCDTDLFMQFVSQINVIYNVEQLEEITIFPKDSIANKKNPTFSLSSMSLL